MYRWKIPEYVVFTRIYQDMVESKPNFLSQYFHILNRTEFCKQAEFVTRLNFKPGYKPRSKYPILWAFQEKLKS